MMQEYGHVLGIIEINKNICLQKDTTERENLPPKRKRQNIDNSLIDGDDDDDDEEEEDFEQYVKVDPRDTPLSEL